MSWGVQFSRIERDSISWSSASSLQYHNDYMSQFALPDWLAGEADIDFIAILESAWPVFNLGCRKVFKGDQVIQIGSSAWLFSAGLGKRSDALRDFAKTKKKHLVAHEIIERTATFLSSLDPEMLGVIRLVEWGKY